MIPLALLALLLASLLACGSSGSTGLPWATDQAGKFYTVDLEKAQKEIPFPIVVPGYVPSHFPQYPNIIGPLKKDSSEGKVMVQISYWGTEGENIILITECNYPYALANPDLNPSYNRTTIAGIEIVETKHTFSFVTPDGPVNDPGFEFSWDKSAVYFVVGVYGYNHDEAVKVVESMIGQD